MVHEGKNVLNQEQKNALALLERERTEENLWNCVVLFQNETFKTMSGLFFTYELKLGRDGKYTKELWVNRRENSKSLTWSSVWRAFEKTEGKPVAARPKDLGDIRGISYIYGIFYRFGLIEVPEQVRVKMAE